MTTTLLLAYSASHICMFMVFLAKGLSAENLLNAPFVAAEVLNILVGSFGVVAVARLYSGNLRASLPRQGGTPPRRQRLRAETRLLISLRTQDADDVITPWWEHVRNVHHPCHIDDQSCTSLKRHTGFDMFHIRYPRVIETAYRNRKTCRDAHGRELKDQKQAVLDMRGDEPKTISVVKQVTIILEKAGQYDRAMEIRQAPLANGIQDGTRTGFAGRINRIVTKAAMRVKKIRQPVPGRWLRAPAPSTMTKRLCRL
jgi:hypothetical protein